jgi:hypothetical protein
MRTLLCLIALAAPTPAATAGAKAPTKLVFGNEMTEAEFKQAQLEFQAGLALQAGFAALGPEELPWIEPPTYDLAALPLVPGTAKVSAAMLPMRVHREEATVVELQVDARAIPDEELAHAKIDALELSCGTQRFPLAKLKIASFDRGPVWSIKVELPAPIAEDAPIAARLSVALGLPQKLRVERFAPGEAPPKIAGFKLLAARPTAVAFEVDDTVAPNGVWLYGESPDGRRIDRTGRDVDDGKTDVVRKAILGKTFAELPAKLEFPEVHVEKIKQLWASPPASFRVVVPLSYRDQALVLTGNSATKPLFHDLEHTNTRACQTAELSHLEVFPHRSVALMGLGNPHLTVIVPDCVNFAGADFRLVGLKAWNKAGQPMDLGPSIADGGFQRKHSGYTWYIEGDHAAEVGKVEGQVSVEVADLTAVAFGRTSVSRDATSGRWTVRVTLPEGAESDGNPALLDEAGLPLELGSWNSSSNGNEVTMESSADLSRVARVIFFTRKGEKQKLTIPFQLDFAKIPAPPKKS